MNAAIVWSSDGTPGKYQLSVPEARFGPAECDATLGWEMNVTVELNPTT
jgi:hypothetical protein